MLSYFGKSYIPAGSIKELLSHGIFLDTYRAVFQTDIGHLINSLICSIFFYANPVSPGNENVEVVGVVKNKIVIVVSK